MKALGDSLLLPVVAILVLPTVARGQGHGQGKGQQKVTICHVPPGNPANAHTLTLPEPAVQAHLGHGDTLGACSGAFGTTNPAGGAAETSPIVGQHGNGSHVPVNGSGRGLKDGETPDAAHGRAEEKQGAMGKGTPEPWHGSAREKKGVVGQQTPDGGHAKAKEKKAHGSDDGGQKPQEKQP